MLNRCKIALIEADCLVALRAVPDRSVNLILCDLPYGTTQNKWDSAIPLDRLWQQYERILAPQGAVLLTGQGPFTARLICSNESWFKYKITWVKSKPTNFLNVKKQPLRRHEDICVFYPRQPKYFPQMGDGDAYDKGVRKNQLTGSYGDFRPAHIKSEGGRFPTDVVYYKTAESEGRVYHATQKPIELGRYLVRTYTAPGDTVLDNAFGSGSFVIAAAQEGRRAIGIELNRNIEAFKEEALDLVSVAEDRLSAAAECDLAICRQHDAGRLASYMDWFFDGLAGADALGRPNVEVVSPVLFARQPRHVTSEVL